MAAFGLVNGQAQGLGVRSSRALDSRAYTAGRMAPDAPLPQSGDLRAGDVHALRPHPHLQRRGLPGQAALARGFGFGLHALRLAGHSFVHL